jgi:hypothetical protein
MKAPLFSCQYSSDNNACGAGSQSSHRIRYCNICSANGFPYEAIIFVKIVLTNIKVTSVSQGETQHNSFAKCMRKSFGKMRIKMNSNFSMTTLMTVTGIT